MERRQTFCALGSFGAVEVASTLEITPGVTLSIRFDPAKTSRVETDLPALEGERQRRTAGRRTLTAL